MAGGIQHEGNQHKAVASRPPATVFHCNSSEPPFSDREIKNAVKRISVLSWYRLLRVHHHRTVFEAIRYALWLAR
jgi:hypothetical protein